MASRVLVTGAAGLLGSTLLKLMPRGVTVDATFLSRPLSIHTGGESFQIDLSDAEATMALLKNNRYDLVINCAGASDVDRCEVDHYFAMRNNILVSANIAASAWESGFRLIHVSSDYVFDGEHGPHLENESANPINFYGLSKLRAEEAVAASRANACVVRVCALYSVENAAPRNLLRGITERLSSRNTYHAADDLFNNPTEVSDLAAAIWKLAQVDDLPRVLHLAGPDHLSRYDFAVRVADKWGYDKSLVERIKIASLNLPAKRPLQAGLKSEHAARIIDYRMRSLSEF